MDYRSEGGTGNYTDRMSTEKRNSFFTPAVRANRKPIPDYDGPDTFYEGQQKRLIENFVRRVSWKI